MGQEAHCTVRLGDLVASGKALLETDELLFRGELRLKISFATISAVAASDGDLAITYPGGQATFELGPKAVQWAERIRHPTTLLDKLGVKPDTRLATIGLSEPTILAELAAQTGLIQDDDLSAAELILLELTDTSDLDQLHALQAAMPRQSAIWAIYPKGKSAPVREADVMAAARAAGLVDVKTARVSASHTALKFMIPRAVR
jgi:hypothetical protein